MIRVPAGAADWDIPYPFPEGEGPETYREDWEKKRAVKLVGELVKLIQGATERAATKKMAQVEKGTKSRRSQPASSTRSNSHRPETQAETPNQDAFCNDIVGANVNDINMISSNPLSLSSGPTPDPHLDKMLQSFLTAMPQPTNQPMVSSSDACSSSLGSSSRATNAFPEFDQTELEAWLSQLGTLPLAGADNYGIGHIATDNSQADGSTDGVPMDVDMDEQTQLAEQQDMSSSVLDSAMSILNNSEPPPMDMSQNFHLPHFDADVPDTAIDPALLALSLPSGSWNPTSFQPLLEQHLWPFNVHVTSSSGGPPSDAQVPSVPSLVHSPISSAGSFPETLTPRLSTEPEPNVHILGQDKVGIGETQGYTGERLETEAFTSAPTQEPSAKKKGKQPVKGKPPKAKASQNLLLKAATTSQSQYYSPDKRQEIFQRAWDRRDELKAKIERAKIELWEVSLEGGVLGVLGKSK
ncbi:hypothetical protein CONPUDRAFT_80659 [Coniophora puteana RWD-64-598 SS2]|uniref:Uncharacterized protein n=1 Tax=Coniophora puteana (strain RWD-64-598) TaxID=741705 RepID=A0A5M3MYM9_CONPW|nr:uncharacterized protein CONPUDRAFT_80659 [Coniophora puteana RWD-64-598 SS2]EIW84258.1 hypothetical protein CONPUDRAFT_80659 [Coniophora puteana RWD-64-598 SS2]